MSIRFCDFESARVGHLVGNHVSEIPPGLNPFSFPEKLFVLRLPESTEDKGISIFSLSLNLIQIDLNRFIPVHPELIIQPHFPLRFRAGRASTVSDDLQQVQHDFTP